METAGGLANRPDIGRARLDPVINRDISAVVEHDTSEVEPDPVGVGGRLAATKRSLPPTV